jgi:alanine-synthesizing transaminase
MKVRLSSRLPADLSPNAVSRAMSDLAARGVPWIDLTASNPTDAGLPYPPDLLAGLADRAALRYEPRPFGLPAAREAVARDYARRGITIPADRIVLTVSSSESYSFLFKLLCDPGDNVLVPAPSYPLFEHLSGLEGVGVRSYRTEYHGAWSIDADEVARTVDDRTRAMLVVSPNNPTGAWLKRGELRSLTSLCLDRGLALVGDEVFCDYPIDPAPDAAASVLEQAHVLTFGLGGLSKSFGLPQVKLGWLAVAGPDPLVQAAMGRLELICDTYLSVGTPVQVASPQIMARGQSVQQAILQRVRGNYETLRRMAETSPACAVLRVEGGWSAVLRVPAIESDEQTVLGLLRDHGVLVHPGYFFDFAQDGHLVLSLLVRPDDFRLAVERIFATIGTDGRS